MKKLIMNSRTSLYCVCAVILFLLLCGCKSQPPASCPDDVSFYSSYSQWRNEKEALRRASSDGSYSVLCGSTDSSTGEFKPSRIMVMECQIGLKAHLHEDFLLEELKRDADVHRILEKSIDLCDKYNILSFAYVVFDPERGYESRTPGDSIYPGGRQEIWLKALLGSGSQPAAPEHAAARRL